VRPHDHATATPLDRLGQEDCGQQPLWKISTGESHDVQSQQSPWVDDLATVSALVRHGLNRQTIRRRVIRGAWLEPLPGVISRVTGTLTYEQNLIAALAYGGHSAALSHATAGSFWSLAERAPHVHITVVHGHHLRSSASVTVHQTIRAFAVRHIDAMALTPPARTVVDMCLELDNIDMVRNVMGRAVQLERVTLNELEQELDLAPSRGSLLPRRAFEEISLNAHAASEARFVRLILDAGLPMPEMNACLATRRGVKIIDALWRDLGKAVEIDGRAFHFNPMSWAGDLSRQNDIQLTGVVVLRIAAHRLWSDPAGVIAELRSFLGI
jgi:hypothetical protein